MVFEKYLTKHFMSRIFRLIVGNPKTIIAAILVAAAFGVCAWRDLGVDVFPDISMPRVTIMTEAGGLTAEEVEQLVTIPIESAVNGIPGVTTVRSSSSGGLSFVWVDFDWNVELSRARFDVYDRLSRVQDSLPAEAHAQIAPVVSVTGEIILVALTPKDAKTSMLNIREIAEYDLRNRLMAVPGIGEVAVMGGRLPEFRISANPQRAAASGLSLFDIIEAARDSRTYLSGGYLPDVSGDEVPLRQLSRADTLAALKSTPVILSTGAALRLGDIADVTVAGERRRGSASYNGREAVILSVQKAPGGNTPSLTAKIEEILSDFSASDANSGIEVHTDAYRQADFISASIAGGRDVVRDAVLIVVIVLLVTLLELRTLAVVLLTMPFSVLLGLALFPAFNLGVNVMTLGGFAVAAGDIVDAAIIFTEVIRRKLGENAALDDSVRRPISEVVVSAASSVAPSVIFSSSIVILVFIPLLLLSGLEGQFFRPLAFSYICIFAMSLVAALTAVPALAKLLRLGGSPGRTSAAEKTVSVGVRVMQFVYRPFLAFAMRLPKTVLFFALVFSIYSIHVASRFGSSFLPPFREDSFNVMISLPPGASLVETERISEAAVPVMMSIPGVLSVTRRTGRAERDQHAEPVSSSEFVVRVDLNCDTRSIRSAIRERLADIPGIALVVGYPIAHRISAVLSGTEAELAVNIFGEDVDVLREAAAKIKTELEVMQGVSDVRANREIAVRSLRVDYDMPSLVEAGITPREAGEQVSAAFNGVEVGEVRNGIRRRAVRVLLEGDDDSRSAEDVKSLVISSRQGKRVKLEEVARVAQEETPNLMLREGGRRKALISCNPAPGVDTGTLVEEMSRRIKPIAASFGCDVSFGGSYEARESAEGRLLLLGAGLVVAIFFILVFALGSARAASIAFLNVPLALVGAVAAVSLTDGVLSVSSLVGFVTVVGFTLRNGILLLNCYRERIADGCDLKTAVKGGSIERMTPIILTSLTTVIGLIPIILASNKPGGELLAPLAVVQFGGIIGSTLLNLVVLPAATLVFGTGSSSSLSSKRVASFVCLMLLVGCQSYKPHAINWQDEMCVGVTNEVRISSPDDAVRLALIGNREINALRLKAANSAMVAKEYGWWEDPSLDFDLMRIINPIDHPIIGGASLAFTIPLSGALKKETEAANAYKEADKFRILSAERALAVDASKCAILLSALHEKRRILEKYDGDARIEKARATVEKLYSAGEVSPGEWASVNRATHAKRHMLMDVTREISEAEKRFLHLTGLMPGAKIAISFTPKLVSREKIKPVEASSLVYHVDVAVALAETRGSEKALAAEICKQYPDLKLGPAYANEEGLGRIGLVAGVTLPLWNRNRKGIAKAVAKRDETRLNAIDIWRALVCDAAAAYSALERLLGHPQVPRSERGEVDELAAFGELSMLDYLVFREEILEQQLAEADWRRDVALQAAELERFK